MHAANPVVPSEGGSSSLGGGGGGAGIWQLPLGLFPWQHWEPPRRACLGTVVCPPGACDVTVGFYVVYLGV